MDTRREAEIYASGSFGPSDLFNNVTNALCDEVIAMGVERNFTIVYAPGRIAGL